MSKIECYAMRVRSIRWMACGLLAAVVVGVLAPMAWAVDPVPNYKFLIHAAIPKDAIHPSAGGVWAADIRNTFETTVETWWKEVSYYEADPASGYWINGFYPDTKTYGHVYLPWAAEASAGGRPDGWANVFHPTVNLKDERPVSFGGEHNFEVPVVFPPGGGLPPPPQLFGGTGALVDGYWTSGERFQDVNGNGQWDPAEASVTVGEQWWNTDNTIDPRWRGGNGVGPDLRGELYADYNNNTVVGNVGGVVRVTTVRFDPTVTIYIADGESNLVVQISEFDLDPNDGIATNDGDFAHEHNLSPGGPDGTNDIPRNGVFNYERDPTTFQPMVYPATLSYDPATALTATYQRLVNTNGTVYTGTTAALDGATLQTIVVPIYQATELWGDPIAALPAGRYGGLDVTWQSGVVVDIEAEPFEDFISWWVPFAGPMGQGAWVCGVSGIANAPNLQAGLDGQWGTVIARADYDKYIRDNYPGDVEALIARAGNGVYDGPDNWYDTISAKMRISGYEGDGGGFLPPEPETEPPTDWDPHGWYPGGWTAWWTTIFGSLPPPTFGSPYNGGSWWPGNGIPRCQAFACSGTTPDAGGWIPALQNTWGYDGPREFQDLPSSLYHLGNNDGRGNYDANPYPGGGDLRLGEVTSPFDEQIFGADLGNGQPWVGTPFADGDDILPCGGPLAFNGSGQYSFDALNVLSMEVATWRTDGQALTGPLAPPVSRGNGAAPIFYGGDHRDVTLDGLIDQGETVPASSHSYFIDDRTGDTSPDGGWTSMDLYPFNWDRYAEDCVQAYDYAENYADAVRYNQVTVDEVINGGAGGVHPHTGEVVEGTITPGVPGLPVANVVGRAFGMPHSQYVLGDTVWVDANTNGTYDSDVPLNAPSGALTNGTVGVALGATVYQAATGSANFEQSLDSVWIDANSNGWFDSETVLADSGQLRAGLPGKLVNWVDPGAIVVYHHRGAGPDTGYQLGDDVWLESSATNAVSGEYDPSDILIATWHGVTNGTPASTNLVANPVYYPRRSPGEPDLGYQFGDDLWLDADADQRFDAEVAVSRVTRYIYTWRDSRALTNGTPGLALGDVRYRDNNSNSTFDPTIDEAWVSYTGGGPFGSEVQLAGPEPANGAVKQYDIPNALFHDADGSLTFEPGDEGVWDERNGDGEYASARNIRLPMYFIGMHNGIGTGLDLAGNTTRVYHRDEQTPIGGYIQVVEAMSLGTLTHEQGHDIQGWPDLYDYDTFDANAFMNHPIGGFDLMGEGGLVHGIPDLKVGSGWTGAIDIKSIFPVNSGAFVVYLYPVEFHRDQYYYFVNGNNPAERFWFWYQSGVQANAYNNFSGPGGQGLHIEHVDFGGLGALPPQQRLNSHFAYHIVQADGLYEMEDGVNSGGPDDVFPGTTGNRLFTADTIPWSRWWDQSQSGLRIIDVQLPSTPTGPALIYFDYYDPTQGWFPPSGGADVDGDGIPDAWEVHYFGSVNVVNGSSDYDGDRLLDYGEYRAGTDPTVKSSVLRISEAAQGAEREMVLSWESVDGKDYAIEASTNLLTGFDILVTNGIAGTPPDNVVTLRLDQVTSPRWYVRVVAEE